MINISTKMSLTIVARARLHTAFLLTQRHCQCSPIGVGVSTPAPSIQTTPPKRPIEGSYNLKCYMSSFYLKMLLSASTPRDLLAGLREEKGTGTKKGETDGRQKAERQEMQTPTFYTRHPHIWFWVDDWRDRRSRTYVHKILQLQREANDRKSTWNQLRHVQFTPYMTTDIKVTVIQYQPVHSVHVRSTLTHPTSDRGLT